MRKPVDETLKKFMLEHFDLVNLRKCGLLKGYRLTDYEGMSARLCWFFGYKTIYEYGTTEIRVHLTFAGDRPKYVNEKGELMEEPFVTVFKSWLDE